MTTEFQYSTTANSIKYDYKVSADEGLARTAAVRIEASSLEKSIDAKVKEYSRTVKLPGFRPGKVPENVVRSRFGESIEAEVLENALKEVYPEMIEKEEKVAGITEVNFDGEPKPRDGAYHFTVRFEVAPEFKLSVPKKIAVTAPTTEVDEAEIDDAIDSLQTERATYNSEEGKAKKGQFADLELNLSENGESLGETRRNRIELGKDQVHADIDKAVIGAKAGEQVDVTIEYGDDDSSGFSGKKIAYAIHISDVQTRELPALDDEFAKSFDNVDDLADLRGKIKDSMAHERLHARENELSKEVLKALREANDFEVPQSVINQIQHRKAEELLNQFAQQGMLQEDQREQTKAFAHQAVRGAAETAAQDTYIIKALSDHFDIKADDQAITEKLDHLGTHYKMSGDQVREQLGEQGLESLTEEVRNELAIKRVVESAKVTDLSFVEFQQLQAKAQADAAAQG